jgi:aldehyde dehydrogenase (NAD+)
MGGCSIEYEPLGVALVISAWNYPIYTAIPQVAAAIAAGNCVILKPSELSSHSSGIIKKLFDNYLNPDFYQCIEGRIEVAKAVTKLPVDVICFTGSTATGRLVAIEAAKNLVPCILELGGKCPVIID